MNSIYSYADFIRNTNNFRVVDRTGENRYDSPVFLYYKLFFYFTDDNGLLGTAEMFDEKQATTIANLTAAFKTNNYERQTSVKNNECPNTAFSFLLLNNELERAIYLKKFVCLLSEINCNSPWYFTEIGGLDAAIERKVFSEGELKIEDKPRAITIKCLQDAYDNRVGMLLDLYRAAGFSYQNKKEIIPANLRKFNMGIALFPQPIRKRGGKSGDENSKIMIPYDDKTYNYYIPSVKYFELRNCEIDVNSSKSAYSTINTTEQPFAPEYTITINYDDCYESRYNEIMKNVVTDFINIDINKTRVGGSENGISGQSTFKEEETMNLSGVDKYYWVNTDINKSEGFYQGATGSTGTTIKKENNLGVVDGFSGSKNATGSTGTTIKKENNLGVVDGFSGSKNATGSNLVSNLAGIATSTLKSTVNKLYMGNIYSFSLSNTASTIDNILSGDVVGGAISLAKQVQNVVKNVSSNSLEGKKLPGFDVNRTSYLSILNKSKSARNNL